MWTVLEFKSAIATAWTWVFWFLRRVKPFADVLAPAALVLFAYAAERVSENVEKIQNQQVEIQKNQANLEVLLKLPILKVTYDDNGRITLGNLGQSPMYDFYAYAIPLLNMAVVTPADDRKSAKECRKYYELPDKMKSTMKINNRTKTNALFPSESYTLDTSDILEDLKNIIPPGLSTESSSLYGPWPDGVKQLVSILPTISLTVGYTTALGESNRRDYYVDANSVYDRQEDERFRGGDTDDEGQTARLAESSIDGVREALKSMGWQKSWGTMGKCK